MFQLQVQPRMVKWQPFLQNNQMRLLSTCQL